MKTFWLCFVPLFVAVDAIGILPIYTGLVERCSQKQQNKIVTLSVLTALAVALLFLFVGEIILRLLNITVADFMIAGGIILFLLSINDLFVSETRTRDVDPQNFGPVPIGVPLMVGPAVLTTIMLLVREYGFFHTTIATILNIVIAGLMFYFSRYIIRILGKNGAKIFSKIANLFLAAIAVMMVRKGIFILLERV